MKLVELSINNHIVDVIRKHHIYARDETTDPTRMGICYNRFKRELYDMEDAPLTLKVRMLKAEVMETLLYGCVT